MLWKYPEEDPIRLQPVVLAYVGDAVFELYIRSRLASSGEKVERLHRDAVDFVSAKAMADYYRKLEPFLNPEESAVLRRGRNAKSRQIKSAGVSQYHMSTGFESLVGYLFLSGQEARLERLLSILFEERET